ILRTLNNIICPILGSEPKNGMELTVSSPPRTKKMFAKYTLNCLMVTIGARPTGAWCLVLGPLEFRRPAFSRHSAGSPQRDHHTSLIESFHSAQIVSSHLL